MEAFGEKTIMSPLSDRREIEHLTTRQAKLRNDYLDLMRDSLIGRLNQYPPLPGGEIDGYREDYRERGWDWPSRAPSMIGAERMENLRRECERVLLDNICGDFMETGVWRGPACIMMRAVLNAYGDTSRKVIAADSFAGTPLPLDHIAADTGAEFHAYADFVVSLEQVQSNFARYGLLDRQVIFLKGLFKHTLPSAPVEQLAILRLDGDTYESTMDGLVALYNKLSIGGSLIVDDYFLFESQRLAVNEYREAHGISDPIVQIDDFGGYWMKRQGSD
jgi:O-methyltransferase